MNSAPRPIRPKDRDTIIRALGAGVVPRVGLQHIQVGRANEVEALLADFNVISEGGSTIRFVIGPYGAGKTFFLNLTKSIALEKKLVAASADLAPDRRLHASAGQARTLYAESIRNMATRNRPEGGALEGVVEKFVADTVDLAKRSGTNPEDEVRSRLETVREMLGGFEFADVIIAYWKAWDSSNVELKASAIRWLRGEYSTRTEARMSLGVRSIVDDSSVYDYWKLLAKFVRLAGYSGLLIVLDELVNIYKLQSARARESNLEQIHRILNDVLQGNSEGIGFVLGGTPEFLRDERRGLFSYPALKSRLDENSFAGGQLIDMSGPVIHLENLTPAHLFVLLSNIRHVFAGGDKKKYLIPDEALQAFMARCEQRLGEGYFRTPRTTVKQFVNLLSVLDQNKGADWRAILGTIEPERDAAPDLSEISDDDDSDLATLKLR